MGERLKVWLHNSPYRHSTSHNLTALGQEQIALHQADQTLIYNGLTKEGTFHHNRITHVSHQTYSTLSISLQGQISAQMYRTPRPILVVSD